MLGATGTVLLGLTLLSSIQVSAAAESAGVIVAGTVAGVILLLICIGVTIVCFYKRRYFNEREEKQKRKKKKHKIFVANGFPPPKPQQYGKHHQTNGFVRHAAPPRMPPPPMMTSMPMPSQPPPVFVEPTRLPTVTVPYATYHGPPSEMRYQMQGQTRPDTMSGPPPIVIPFETTAGSGGTVTFRPDPRPVIHKQSKYKKRERIDTNEDRKRSSSKHRSPSRHRSQEFVVQQSHDGIPVIRPVIYIDDDEEDRHNHRSKSRDRRHKRSTQSPKDGAQITEITDETQAKEVHAEVEINTDQSQSRLLTPPPTKHERSRASSVTEAVNALRMSVKGHLDDDSDSDMSHSSKAPSFGWAQSEHRAPDPVAGDVLFFPAGTAVEKSRNTEPRVQERDEIYSYTKVIKSSTKERAPSPESPVPVPGPKPNTYGGYEVPKDLRRSTAGTREEYNKYQIEHDPITGPYTDIGASMSDRLQHLVEDGDKTRFSHYNVGAIDFAEEEVGEDKPVQMRVKRPETPPVDIPRDSFYSTVIKRPKSPENDIPLVSPRESTEVPPLNLTSTVNSPREQSYSYRPATPPKDFPITPHSSFMRPRPPTPPTDFPMTPKASVVSPRPPSPPYDVLDTSRLGETHRSTAVDPATGEPGSFQARQRLIEAYLQKNVQTGPSTPKPAQSSVPKHTFTPAPPPPSAPVVTVTPGVIPPAPPPPPLPK